MLRRCGRSRCRAQWSPPSGPAPASSCQALRSPPRPGTVEPPSLHPLTWEADSELGHSAAAQALPDLVQAPGPTECLQFRVNDHNAACILELGGGGSSFGSLRPRYSLRAGRGWWQRTNEMGQARGTSRHIRADPALHCFISACVSFTHLFHPALLCSIAACVSFTHLLRRPWQCP